MRLRKVQAVTPEYMTPREFFEHVLAVAKQAGYDTEGAQHPEDIVVNLVPIMDAWAQGWGRGLRAGRGGGE